MEKDLFLTIPMQVGLVDVGNHFLFSQMSKVIMAKDYKF